MRLAAAGERGGRRMLAIVRGEDPDEVGDEEGKLLALGELQALRLRGAKAGVERLAKRSMRARRPERFVRATSRS